MTAETSNEYNISVMQTIDVNQLPKTRPLVDPRTGFHRGRPCRALRRVGRADLPRPSDRSLAVSGARLRSGAMARSAEAASRASGRRDPTASLELDLERSADRGLTSKALLRLADGNLIESVLMRYPSKERSRSRRTVCVSSQVGCAVGCPFCATGLLGLKRHLTAAEIAGQVLYFTRRVREIEGDDARITNVVFMGEGEPLANIKNVWPAIELLNAPDAIGLGARR